MINRTHPILDAAEVSPGLWIGSHPPVRGHRCDDHREDYNADMAACGFGFLALCAQEYQPDVRHFPGVEVCYAPFDDNQRGISRDELRIARSAAQKTVNAHRRGRACLVTCMAGRNRSGLVTALALAELSGMDAAEACEAVRDKRGLAALTNMSFRGILGRVGKNPLSGGAKKACELCEARSLTRRYHEDAICWIADCKTCRGVPMVVYREHGRRPLRRHMQHMHELLRMCGRPRHGGYYVDDSMHSEPRHYHAHLRPA